MKKHTPDIDNSAPISAQNPVISDFYLVNEFFML